MSGAPAASQGGMAPAAQPVPSQPTSTSLPPGQMLQPPSGPPAVPGPSPPASVVSTGTARGGLPLAAGWEVRYSKSKNRPFYVNTATGTTQWEHPGVVRTVPRALGERVLWAAAEPRRPCACWGFACGGCVRGADRV
jgi:hypothetical protein